MTVTINCIDVSSAANNDAINELDFVLDNLTATHDKQDFQEKEELT